MHQYYYLGVNSASIQARNNSERLGYFYRYESLDQWEKRLTSSSYPPVEFTVSSTTLELIYTIGHQRKPYYHERE